ncbi:MAG TPA: MFS transporter [Gemmatimonadaceae bacterium]|nr:MFS transporter [Gemmatimonadaceae bacterium]
MKLRLGRNVIALAAVSFFTDASSEMIYPLLPLFLTATLGASAAFVGAIEGAADSVSALLKLASGWLSDRTRRRKPLVVVGYALASAVRPLVAIAQTGAHVLLIRVTDRLGKGIRGAPRDALIADSVDPALRGRAFGFHRAADHAGAVIGPLIVYVLMSQMGVGVRTIFWLAAIPAAFAVITLIIGVREPRPAPPAPAAPPPPSAPPAPLSSRFFAYLAVLLLFTLGNSTDAFLLLRASELGVSAALLPVLWAMLHLVKSLSSTPGGTLSDRRGRKPVIVAGWMVYALVYLMFGHATDAWHVWVLFAIYGLYFGLTEGVERALVADIVPPSRRGAAFGWYNLAIGLGALPASVIFGTIYDRFGAFTAFSVGAAAAMLASIGLWIVVPSPTSPART